MRRLALMLLVVGLLSAGSCVTPGAVTNDFCLVNTPLMPKDRTVSDYLSDNDPRLAEGLIGYNTYGERECSWSFE